jgi:hypothetical protein
MRILQRWRVPLQLFIVALILFFLLRALLGNWQQVASYPWHFRYHYLALSLILLVGTIFVWASVWKTMLSRLGEQLSTKDGIRIYILSNTAKYLPGSIWGYVGRAYMGYAKGLSQTAVWLSSFLEVAVTVVASLILFSSSLILSPSPFSHRAFVYLAAVAALSLLSLWPPLFNRATNLLLSRLHRPGRSSLGYLDMIFFLSMAFLIHAVIGLAFYLFVSAVMLLPSSALPSLIGAWSFSATVGLVSFFAPYGLGVKEGILSLLLSMYMPTGTAAAVALLSRVWSISGELLSMALLLIWERRKDREGTAKTLSMLR